MKNNDNNDRKIFEARSLQEAYEQVTKLYDCSITDLDIDVIQQPSKGFLGFGKKSAIIEVIKKYNSKSNFKKKEAHFNTNIKIEDVSTKLTQNDSIPQVDDNVEDVISPDYSNDPQVTQKEKIFDNFYDKEKSTDTVSNLIIKKSDEDIVVEVKEKVNELFSHSCFDIDEVKVEVYDHETIYVEFNGEDSALLIGKEGYRYKALSYILFNWINEKYGKMLRLEVAEFLKNQEEAINAYLLPVIETIYDTGTYKTKPLDGILVHIALKRLREEFPNKYVAVKTNQKGDKYVLVNEYRSSLSDA